MCVMNAFCYNYQIWGLGNLTRPWVFFRLAGGFGYSQSCHLGALSESPTLNSIIDMIREPSVSQANDDANRTSIHHMQNA